jgi:cell division GTPase FtsZ
MKDITNGDMEVVLLVAQGIADMAHTTSQLLIDQGEEDRHRYQVLKAAVQDLADRVDSRKLAAALYNLTDDVAALSRDEVAQVAETINTNVWDRESARLPYGVHPR